MSPAVSSLRHLETGMKQYAVSRSEALIHIGADLAYFSKINARFADSPMTMLRYDYMATLFQRYRRRSGSIYGQPSSYPINDWPPTMTWGFDTLRASRYLRNHRETHFTCITSAFLVICFYTFSDSEPKSGNNVLKYFKLFIQGAGLSLC